MTNHRFGSTCRPFVVLIAAVLQCVLSIDGLAQTSDITPQSLQFRRQATRRMIFDRSQQIPLASLRPGKTVGLDLMHPEVGDQTGEPQCAIEKGRLRIWTSDHSASSARWVGGFNPFATYELSLHQFKGTGRIGLRFCDPNLKNHLSACIVTENGKHQSIEWVVVKEGQEVSRQAFAWPGEVSTTGPVRLRVQMLAVGANLYIESQGKSHLVGYPDFNEHLDLRRKDLIGRYEFRLISNLEASSSTEIAEVLSALTPGCGQADIRAITNQNGEKEQFPLMSIGIGIVTPSKFQFADIREITELAAEERRKDI